MTKAFRAVNEIRNQAGADPAGWAEVRHIEACAAFLRLFVEKRKIRARFPAFFGGKGAK